MKLKDLDKVFGLSVDELKASSTMYVRWSWAVYLADALVMLCATAYMFYHGIKYQIYGIVLVIVCVLVNLVAHFKMHPERHELYKFYKKNHDQFVLGKCYGLTWSDLHEMMKRVDVTVKSDTSMGLIIQKMIAYGCSSLKGSLYVGQRLSKYEVESGGLKCFMVERGNKTYFIGVVDNKEEEK